MNHQQQLAQRRAHHAQQEQSPYLQAVDEPAPPPPADTVDDEPVELGPTPPPSYRSPSSSPTRSRTCRPLPTPPAAAPEASTSTATESNGVQQEEDTATCFICYDNGGDEPLRHHCACTLVAHSSCLLQWLLAQRPSSTAPHCSACKTPYIIISNRVPRLLRLYQRSVRRLEKASVGIAAMGAGAGLLAALNTYSVWAIRQWAGDKVAHDLLSSGFSHYLTLPLLPFLLVLARTPLLDSALPTIPILALAWSSTHDPLPSFSYPPSPALTACLLPWLRFGYLRLRDRVFEYALSETRRHHSGVVGMIEELIMDQADGDALDEGEREARDGARFVAEVELTVVVEEEEEMPANGRAEEGGGAVEGQAQQEEEEAPQQQQEANDPAPPAPRAVENRIHVGLSRVAAYVVYALLYPLGCSMAGAGLFWLCKKNFKGVQLLRKLLGVSALFTTTAAFPRSTAYHGSTLLGYMRSVFATPAAPKGFVDPVWVRNTIGGTLAVIVKDAFSLAAKVTEEKRRASRRIVGRPVRRIVQPAASQEEQRTWSGGVDANGREARVNLEGF